MLTDRQLEDLKIHDEAFEEGRRHASMSPETREHLEKMTDKIEKGFEKNSQEHQEIKGDISFIKEWKAKVEGMIMGAGKSFGLVWVVVALIVSGVISPLIVSYMNRNLYISADKEAKNVSVSKPYSETP